MSVDNLKNYSPTDPELIDKIVNSIKAKGIFDQFRRDCLADVDTKPAYQNLQQRVNGTVSGFLATQKWQHGLNKTQLRESLRRHTVQQAFLEVGVDRIVDQVVNPKIFSVFMPKVEDVVCECLGIEKPKLRREPEKKLSPIKKPSPPPSPYREREKTPPPVPIEEKIEEEKNDEPPQDLPKSIEEPSPVPAQSSSKENPELPEDLEPVSPASEPEVVNNDDDSNTFDEMPLLAALIDADSNHVESSALDSAPQTCITKSGGPSELSNSHSMLSARPQLEYDTSTNNLSSLKSDDKLSPTKKFDNFSNLGEKLKQSDVNLRETSANKNDDEMTVVDLTELSGSPNDQLKADESKIVVLDESNTYSADNKIEPTKNELLNNDLSYSNDSFSSSEEPITIKSDESKTEFSPVSKYSNHKKLGNSPLNATKSMKIDEDKDHNDKAVESKKKDKGKTSKHSSQAKSSDDKSKGSKEEKHKSQHDTSNIRSEKSSKQDNEKDRKDKTAKSDKIKTEETKVNDNRYSSKKKKEETSHSSKLIKDSKSDKKMDETPKTIEKDKYKDDKDKKSDHAKVRNESTSSVSSSKSDKKKTDKTAGEDKSKSSRKRKSGRCNEDGDKSKNPRRSSDRDGSGSGSSGKPKPNNSLKSEAKKSTSDKGRSQHKSKNSSKSNTENESQMSATEEDEVERMLIEINNSIEDESLRVDMSELLGETVKKPKIANNFHEMKRIIKFRKHHVEKEVNSPDTAEAKNLMEGIVPDESDIPLDDPKLLSSPNETLINVCNEENPINEANTNAVTSGLAKQMGLKQLSVLVEDVMRGSSARLVPNSSSSVTAEMTIDSSTVCDKAAVNDDLTIQLMDDLDRSSGSNEKSKPESVNAKESEISLDDHVQDTLSSLNSKTKLVSEPTVIDESSKHELETSTKCVEDGFPMSDEKNPTSLAKNGMDVNDNPSSKTESVDDSNARSKKCGAREPNDRKSTPSLLSDRSRRKNAGSLMYAILEEVNGPKIKEGEAGNVPSSRANKRKIKSEQKSLAEPSKSNESVARSDSCSLDDGSDISNKENDETNVSSKGKPKNDAATTNMSKQTETRLNRKKSQMREGELCKSDNNSKELIYAANNKHYSNDSEVIDAKRSTAPLNLRNAESDVTFGPLSCSQPTDCKRMKENRDAPQMIDRKINATHHSMENVRIGSYLSASLLRRKSCPAIFHSGDNVDYVQALQDNEARTGKMNQSSNLFKTTRNPSVETLTAEPATAITCVTKLTEISPAIESESAEVKSKATLPPKELINGGIDQFREVDGSSDRMTVKGRSVGTRFHNQTSIRKSKRLTKPEPDSGIHTSSNTSIDNASNTEEIPVDGSSVITFNKNSGDAVPTETLNNAVPVPLTSSWLDDSTESEFKGFSGDEGCFDGDEDFGGFTDDDIQKAFDQLRILQNSGPNKPSRTSTEMNSSTLRTTRANKKIASEDSTIHLSAIVKELSCTKILEREEDSSLSKCKATSKDSGLCDSPEMEKSEELYSEVESTDYGVTSQRTTRTSSSRKLQMSRHSDLLLESPPAKTRTLNTRKSRVTQSYETNDLYKPRPSLRSHR